MLPRLCIDSGALGARHAASISQQQIPVSTGNVRQHTLADRVEKHWRTQAAKWCANHIHRVANSNGYVAEAEKQHIHVWLLNINENESVKERTTLCLKKTAAAELCRELCEILTVFFSINNNDNEHFH